MSLLYRRTFGQGPPLVLVHGWGLHSGVWGRFADQLAQHFQVTCIDLPGYGLSPICGEFTLDNISTLLAETVTDACCWLGWSLGASVVLDLAVRFPERVNCLVLLAGNPCFVQTSEHSQWPGMPVSMFEQFSTHLWRDPERTLAQFLALQVHGLPEAKIYLKQLKQMVSNYPMPSLPLLKAGLDILRQSHLQNLQAISHLPISVILAEQDHLVPVSVQHTLVHYPLLNVQVIEGAGHAVFLTHAEQLEQLIRDFLRVL